MLSRRSFARALYPHGSIRRVLRGPARGMRFVVQEGIGATYALGTEAAAPRFFQRHISPGMTIVDVGANKGQMTLIFASLVGPHGHVIAIEPAPVEFASLERNVRLNDLAQVALRQEAASVRESALEFWYDPARPTTGQASTSELEPPSGSLQAITVRARSLDAMLEAGPRPDVIKIDVEGAGAAVLRGAERTLETQGPAIYIELHGPGEQAAIRDELLERGYRAETLDGRFVRDPTDGWSSPLWCVKARGVTRDHRGVTSMKSSFPLMGE